jgi:hypothetical protein
VNDDSEYEDYQCLKSERELFITFYRFGVVNEKYLKAIRTSNYNNAVRFSKLWIDEAINRTTAERETITTSRS